MLVSVPITHGPASGTPTDARSVTAATRGVASANAPMAIHCGGLAGMIGPFLIGGALCAHFKGPV
jgi:hypothetical protein